MGEFYLLLVVLGLYYFFDMSERRKTRYKVVKRRSATPVFKPFIASLMRSLIVFSKRKHKFAFFSNNYTAIKRRLATMNIDTFDIPNLNT